MRHHLTPAVLAAFGLAFAAMSNLVVAAVHVENIPHADRALLSAFDRAGRQLRGYTLHVDDPSLRSELESVGRRVAALSHSGEPASEPRARLSPRETDVLACAALGATNSEIAATLELQEGTVKSYLQSAMAKLDASTRHAAVARARRAGLLP